MLTFSLDSAGKTAGVALVNGDELIYESYLSAGLTHSETLLELVNDAFSATGFTPKNVDLFSVALGPGSFTGLRIGLALLKGLALPFGTLCAGVSTLEALAEGCISKGIILSALDARRGEVYYAIFEKTADGLQRLTDDTADKAEIALAKAEEFGKPITFIGDGAQLCYDLMVVKGDNILYPKDQIYGRASAVARVGEKMFSQGKAVDANLLSPVYHRFSQAERTRKERLEKEELEKSNLAENEKNSLTV
ncbi:MAG: tRNA (adenosine(37)-N6)-threonylcarbamoyltransferase complex dimerization subunit type 1 TsaB [Oscillospiraceae bacterium]